MTIKVLVFDLELRRPACAILQAALGGTPGIASRFPAESWLLEPTPDMRAYQINEADLQKVVQAIERIYTKEST